MVHALLVEQLRAIVLVDRAGAWAAAAAGADVGDLPDPETEVTRFEELLAAEPEEYDTETDELLTALGLRGRHG